MQEGAEQLQQGADDLADQAADVAQDFEQNLEAAADSAAEQAADFASQAQATAQELADSASSFVSNLESMLLSDFAFHSVHASLYEQHLLWSYMSSQHDSTAWVLAGQLEFL